MCAATLRAGARSAALMHAGPIFSLTFVLLTEAITGTDPGGVGVGP
jgi:hypothetical protein